MTPEETIDFHIRWAWAKISKAYNIEAAKFGGTMSIGYVLLNIDKEGTPSTKLGPKMGMEPTSLSRLLKKMEEDDLIRKEADTDDKRIVKIFLTKKGKEMREPSKSAVIKLNNYFREHIPLKKLEVFLEVMQSINGTLENPDVFAESASKTKKKSTTQNRSIKN